MNKKRNTRKIGAALLTCAITMGMAIQGSAATSYTPVSGTYCNFNKYLIMDAGDNVPHATFALTITPGTAISADTSDNSVMEVMAGVGTPTIASVTFAPGDPTATEAGTNIDISRTQADRTGTAGTDTVQLDAGEKYATKQATADFSSVSFSEPGIYRYIITETADTAHAAAGIVHDTDTDRVLDVYVTDDGNGALVVSGYVLHTDEANVVINTTMGSADVASAGAALEDKTDGFTNEYVSKDLKVEKEVTGNQASRDKYFEFTVTVTGIADDDSYTVSIADDNDANTNDGSADATSGAEKTGGTIAANAGKTNPTTVTGTDLKAGQKFYLQHGQSVVIRGIALDAEYTVSENAEDYKSEVKSGDTNTGVIGTIAGENKMATAGFTNTRSGIIPTGIAIAAGPAAAILLLGGARLVSLLKKKREENDEEEA